MSPNKRTRSKKNTDLTPQELESERAEHLPNREVMSLLSVSPQAPIPFAGDGELDPVTPTDPVPKDFDGK